MNISPRELKDPDFAGVLQAELQRHHLTSSDVGLEVTEGVFIDEQDAASHETLEQLAQRQASPSCSTTSAPATQHLPRCIAIPSAPSRSTASSSGPSGHLTPRNRSRKRPSDSQELSGLEVIAEGVETETQLDYLIRIGCNAAQGFGIARPAPAAAITGLLEEGRVARPAPHRAPNPLYLPAPAPQRERTPRCAASISRSRHGAGTAAG